MKAFLDENFLLTTETAQKLYHEHAAKMPIIDYHCHINPQEIADDKKYRDITEVWLGGDHYKWRAMRCNGVQECDITGSKDTNPYKTFEKWAETLPKCIGNPLYHWTYLELKAYFGITKVLKASTAKEIYDECNEKLKDDSMSVRNIIKNSNVTLICTTDDPIDSLEYHKEIAADATCEVKVLPAFRPDKAMNINLPTFPEYMVALGNVCGFAIESYADFKKAMEMRIDFFNEMGCKASDHALDFPVCVTMTEEEVSAFFAKGLAGEALTSVEVEGFKTEFLKMVAALYYKYNWVMQIHYGCIRNVSTAMFDALGPDTGFDVIGEGGRASALAGLLNQFTTGGYLPKMVLYSLNQYDNEAIATIASAFAANSDVASRIQLGSAWWFNDTKTGMQKQLIDLANLGTLGNFIGMLTDSRSFLSYTRHEYFRRILCEMFGNLVENGEYHDDMESLGQMVEDICYNNTVKFFGFDV